MGIGSNVYNVFLIAHVVAATVAFGPLFVYPALHRAGETSVIAKMHLRLVLPALGIMWVLGMGLAGLSDGVWKVSQLWLTLAIVIWVILMAVSWFLIRPALTDPSDKATSLLGAGIGITHLGLVVSLYLMTFKPGL